MKRSISILLCLVMAMCLILPCTSYAAQRTEGAVCFANEVDATRQLGVSTDTITFRNLAVVERETDDGINCRMAFTLNVGQSVYEIVATGLLDEYMLENGSRFLHGCLCGNQSIGEKEYAITIGLTKIPGDKRINAGVVLMPNDEPWSDDVVVFSMGDFIVSSEMQALLMGDNYFTTGNTSEGLNNATEANRSMGNVLRISTKISDEVAQSIRVRITPNMSAIDSYIKEHYGYTSSGGGVNYSLQSITVGVRENSNLFNIAGIYTSAVKKNTATYGAFKSVVWAVVCDALASFSLPLNTLAAMFKDRTTKPIDINAADECCITLSGKDLYNNIGTYGVAADFGTSPCTSLTSGSSYATGYGNVRFKISQNTPLSGMTTFYIDTGEVTKIVGVKVGKG
mgnify:CR=1 FL=1